MADETPLTPGQAPDEGLPLETTSASSAADSTAKTGFFSTRNGKLVLIGGAVAILLVVAGIAAALLLTVFGILGGKAAAPVAAVSPGSAISTTAPPETSSSASITVAPIGNADIYTARDPFLPRIANPLATATPTPSGTTTPSGSPTGTAGDQNTLTLLSIVTKSGVRMGNFLLGSTPYQEGAGDRLGSSPWQVISVDSNSAVVLYGDEQVTLVVGQGITK